MVHSTGLVMWIPPSSLCCWYRTVNTLPLASHSVRLSPGWWVPLSHGRVKPHEPQRDLLPRRPWAIHKPAMTLVIQAALIPSPKRTHWPILHLFTLQLAWHYLSKSKLSSGINILFYKPRWSICLITCYIVFQDISIAQGRLVSVSGWNLKGQSR